MQLGFTAPQIDLAITKAKTPLQMDEIIDLIV